MTQATCTKCGRTLALELFCRDRSKASGRTSRCKQCINAKSKAYYYANHETAKVRCREYQRRKTPLPTANYADYAPRSCETCRCEYKPHRKDQRHCSKTCHSLRLQSIADGYWALCIRCNKTFLRSKREAARYPDSSYCSRRCTKAHHSTALVGPIPTGPRSRTQDAPAPRLFTARSCVCGQTVIAEGRRAPATCGNCPPIPFTAGYCGECGDSFVYRNHTDQRYCSDTCARRNHRRRGKQVRSKRIQQAARRETIDLAAVAARDGWRCHICKRTVTRKDWSLDHLIPLSHAGNHTHDNVALAHFLCNSLRGDRGLAQLRLAA